MAEQINLGWLKDHADVKFAPYTLAQMIYNTDGSSYANSVSTSLNNLNNKFTDLSKGIGASGTWDIDINGTADKAIHDNYGNTIIATYETKEDAEKKLQLLQNYLPKSAGEDQKLTGPLGLTENIMYGTELPATGFDGQLFFLEDNTPSLPLGGEAGHVLIKNSATDGDASWKELVALPKGGSEGQVLVKSSTTDGDATWSTDINGNAATATTATKAVQDGNGNTITSTYLPLTGGTVSGTVTTSGEIISTNVHPLRSVYGSYGLIQRNDGDRYWFLPTAEGDPYGTWANTSVSIQLSNGALYGAVWNDYAEFRNQKEVIKPGYCVASADNGEVYRTTEKFQACDGIVSDTFGFAIGETDECKTPLAVAGRVLAYYSGNREDYHAGDTVCAGPEGKVCKMTREEIREWPDRIIGIVSEIPQYETWGSGNVKVDNRIWIKVR